ncbi:MAG: bifunctional DNA-formamidopyrimidine glycosylase/DNA-(apurinic or apyrimidinic site) lyase [bacterium]|nr:bifunctional DNA-formamidopyrimidine glycosylase/DNA-(apurinic or apyrimidinic site) lyase [bacterium]
MPELPEVETIRQDLRKKLLNKTIVRLQIIRLSFAHPNAAKVIKVVQGAKIKAINRRGKLMIFVLSGVAGSGGGFTVSPLRTCLPAGRGRRSRGGRVSVAKYFLLLHLKMTGQLMYRIHGRTIAGGHSFPHELNSLPNKHTQVIFTFADHSQLFFNDMRQFGYIKLVDEAGLATAESRFGIEAMDKKLTLDKFKDILGQRMAPIKAVLLDQTKIAGIGNIYADEICFCASVRPNRKVKSLKAEEIKRLRACIPSVLKIAIKNRGTTFSDYLDSEGKSGGHAKFLQVYDRDGEKCKRCKKGIIQKMRAAGRGTHFCPVCQK